MKRRGEWEEVRQGGGRGRKKRGEGKGAKREESKEGAKRSLGSSYGCVGKERERSEESEVRREIRVRGRGRSEHIGSPSLHSSL
jgi:hypothetical protein